MIAVRSRMPRSMTSLPAHAAAGRSIRRWTAGAPRCARCGAIALCARSEVQIGRRHRPPLIEGIEDVMRAGRRVAPQQVAVGPVLDREPERVLPVVEDLAAEDV